MRFLLLFGSVAICVVGCTPETKTGATVELAEVDGESFAPASAKTRRVLLEKAEDWQIPQPVAGSQLLKIWAYGSGSGSDPDSFFVLGFVAPGKPGHALVGFEDWDLKMHSETQPVPAPAELSLADIAPSYPFARSQEVNFGLVTGIQLVRHGHERAGWALIRKSVNEDAGHAYSPVRSPAREDPVLMLARACLAAAINDITSPGPNFRQIKQRIERLVADQPKLKSKATAYVLKGLKANVRHKPGRPGSIDRMVDDYLLGGGTQGALSFSAGRFTPEERTLVLKGFEAVPALLKQRHSKRFTNHLMQGFNNFPSYPMTADEVIHAYLQRLANDELGSNWLDRQKGYLPKDRAVLAWWKWASKLGEKAYVRTYTVVLDKQKDDAKVSSELMAIANARYPELLPEIKRRIRELNARRWFRGLMKSITL